MDKKTNFNAWYVLIAVAGYVIFGQKLDLAAIIGLGLIISGVVVLHVFSSTTPD